jgi:hypothetical protein
MFDIPHKTHKGRKKKKIQTVYFCSGHKFKKKETKKT